MEERITAEHYFETDASQALRERRAAKSSNANGSPVKLKSKLVAVIGDPTTNSCVFVAESAGTVRRVNIDTGEVKQAYRGPTAPVTSVAIGGPNNATLFAGCWDKDIWSWDLATAAPGRKYSGHSDFVKTLVCTKIGSDDYLISGGADKKILVRNLSAPQARPQTIQDQTVQMLAVQHLAVDPVPEEAGSIILVSASSDPHVRRWRVAADKVEQLKEASPGEKGAVRHSILEHDTTVYRVLFDAEGEEVDLWTASGDGTAKCLSRAEGYAVADTMKHGDHVRAVAVTDDWVITAGRDEDIKVWDRTTGKVHCVLEGHYDEVTDMVVLPTPGGGAGKRLVSVSIDGTVRTWPLERTELDRLIEELAAAKAKGAAEEAAEEPAGLMTADEEAELAALMDED